MRTCYHFLSQWQYSSAAMPGSVPWVRQSSLNNHALTGERQEQRSFNITGDWCLIYELINTDTIHLLDIDTHHTSTAPDPMPNTWCCTNLIHEAYIIT